MLAEEAALKEVANGKLRRSQNIIRHLSQLMSECEIPPYFVRPRTARARRGGEARRRSLTLMTRA